MERRALYQVRLEARHFNAECWFSYVYELHIIRETKKSWLVQSPRNGTTSWLSKKASVFFTEKAARSAAWERNVVAVARLESGLKYLRAVCEKQELVQ